MKTILTWNINLLKNSSSYKRNETSSIKKYIPLYVSDINIIYFKK